MSEPIGSGQVEVFLCRGAQGSRDYKPPAQFGDDDTGCVWMSWWVETPAHVDEAHALAVKHAGFYYPPDPPSQIALTMKFGALPI